MKLHHIGMNVKSLEHSRVFYQTYFGFEEEMYLEWGCESILFLKKDDFRLELIEEAGEEMVTGRAFIHIALRVEELEHELEVLNNKGLLPVEGPLLLENGWKVAFFFGVEGEIIELVEEG